MPLKLIPPRPGRSPNYSVRGTYLGHPVDRSTGTSDRRVAGALLKKWREEIESGAVAPDGGVLFTVAGLAYTEAGGEGRYLEPLYRHFATATIDEIDQIAVDLAAATLYPHATPATRNRQVYTPVSAVLNHARPDRPVRFRRPKEGPQRTHWLTPEQFELLYANLIPGLRPLAVFLVYSGCRLGEALALEWQTVSLRERIAVIPPEVTKTGEGRALRLTDRMVLELAALSPDGAEPQGRVFRAYRNRWSVAHSWRKGATAAGVPWASPHILRHTWATWMRRYGGADGLALLATRAWKDLKSVRRYDHLVVSEEAKRADNLPGSKG